MMRVEQSQPHKMVIGSLVFIFVVLVGCFVNMESAESVQPISNVRLNTMRSVKSPPAVVCPPKGFDTKKQFSLDKYINKRWYAIQQVPVSYQPLDTFFCTYAEYTIAEETWWCKLFSCPLKINVMNRATRGLNGPEIIANLSAVVEDEDPARLLVGPRFLPSYLYGPYWVIEVGSYAGLEKDQVLDDEYEWVIVTGGEPNIAMTKGKCLPGKGPATQYGMWYLSTDPQPSKENIAKITKLANDKGLDTDAWHSVQQVGCRWK